MPHEHSELASVPEFSRVLTVADLPGQGGYEFNVTPDADERVALARLFGALAVRKVRFTGILTPEGKGDLRLTGKLGATIVQACVVTLAPVTTRLDIPITRHFAPRTDSIDTDITFDPEAAEDEDTEILTSEIDLGLIATEAFAMSLPDYPRASDAKLENSVFAAPGIKPLSDEDARPFSQLAALRGKLDS